MMTENANLLKELAQPFHPSRVTWKPGVVKGERALALAYADVRVYMDRLDDVCGFDWSVTYEPWGADRIICRLTIAGVTRSSTGETTDESERSEIGGTVAEAQAFKRAGAMFGLGRYLYNLPSTWADYDPSTRQFTAPAKAKLMNALVTHYRRTLGSKAEPVDESTEQPATPPPAQPKPQPAVEPWKEWEKPEDAYDWAVGAGFCNAVPHCRNALRSIIDRDFGGHITKVNWRAVAQAFYQDRIQRKAEKAAA